MKRKQKEDINWQTQETYTLYAYIERRINGKRTDHIVQDLIDDMARDRELPGMTGAQIVTHIVLNGCMEAVEVLETLLKSYKQYCRNHGYKPEELPTI